MIGKRIKELRDRESKSREELSRFLGVTTSMIGMYETGARNPSFETLTKIADYFHVTTDYLLGRTNSPDPAPVEKYLHNSFLRTSGKYDDDSSTLLDELNNMTVQERAEIGYSYDMHDNQRKTVDKILSSIKSSILKPVPVLGIIRAGEPIRAEENIIGYEYLPEDTLMGADYFGLKVEGDSMSASKINDGDTIIVREQPDVENGQIAVVLVDGENATVKKLYKTDTMVTLMPDSINKEYQPRFIDTTKEKVQILGKVVKVIMNI